MRTDDINALAGQRADKKGGRVVMRSLTCEVAIIEDSYDFC